MKLVYVAGAFRAPTHWWVEQNIRIAESHAITIWKAGAVGICPHAMGRFYDKEIPDGVVLSGTLALMKRCDAVFMVPENWKQSSGAVAERQAALKLEIPIFYDMAELKTWIDALSVL